MKICAWCTREMPGEPGTPSGAGLITHGICPACLQSELGGLGTPLITFLDQLAIPVAVVNDNAEVRYANDAAQRLLGKTRDEAAGRLAGEVFECVNASEPGGCGKTNHCSACAIRGSVTRTALTGEPCVNVQATLHWHADDDPAAADLVLSTEKLNDVVLLRIDELKPQK